VREVIVQRWEEYVPGRGYHPDGYSLHVSEEERKAYIAQHQGNEARAYADEKARPDGAPYAVLVPDRVYGLIQGGQHGIRCEGVPDWQRVVS
jgi:hypothetical protein